jgi:hypothetical protein
MGNAFDKLNDDNQAAVQYFAEDLWDKVSIDPSKAVTRGPRDQYIESVREYVAADTQLLEVAVQKFLHAERFSRGHLRFRKSA